MTRFGMLLLLGFGGLCLALPAGDRSAPDHNAVSLQGRMTVARALQEIRRQTGAAVTEERGDSSAEVSLNLQRASFWQAVDALAAGTRTKAVPSSRDGTVTLTPLAAGDRRPPVSYDGPFRVRVLRVSTSRELDSERATCTVGLEVTWTPTLRPLFLEGQPQQVRLRNTRGQDIPVAEEGSSLAHVDGRYSFTLDVTLPALPRAESHIGQLDGRLLAVAPSKMLRFGFDAALLALSEAPPGGAQRRLVQEDVVCRLPKIRQGPERWSIQVALDYPAGNRRLESFQAGSLVANNELVLHRKDGKGTPLRPTNYVIDQVSSRRAVVTYHFTDRQGTPRRGRAADWKVVYHAPARIVDLPFRFSFRNVPLP